MIDFVCTMPFEILNVYNNNNQYFCCKEWLDIDLSIDTQNENVWLSEKAEKLRDSILNGEYNYCSKINCPYLATTLKTNKRSGCIIPKSEFLENYDLCPEGPNTLIFSFDFACNMSCPSCRSKQIPNTKKRTEETHKTIKNLSMKYGKTVQKITLSGAGDPFYSAPLFDFLKTIDQTSFESLKQIHLHTNGILWTPQNWDKIKQAHQYVKSCEISIDASKKQTYDKIRKGGSWTKLMRNLEFINEISTLKDVIVSFVIQDINYKEMYDFYVLMDKILNKKTLTFQYYTIQDWGAMTPKEYNEKQVWKKEHKNNQDFLIHAQKLMDLNDKRIVMSVDW